MHCNNIIKSITLILLSFLVLCALTATAFADEGIAIGNFPDGTNENGTGESQTDQVAEEKRILLSGGVSYAPASGMFYRAVESGSFGVSVPDGAIITGSVSVELSPSLTPKLYKNGIEQNNPDMSHIADAGKYILAVSANDSTQTIRVGFTIVKSPTCDIKEYQMPSDFYVVSATFNGEEASYSQTYVDMTSDGDYVINYRSPEADKDMQLAVTIDHTPPTATLTGITDGKANGPVTVSDIEEGARVYLTRNGNRAVFADTISETGAYVLTVKDEAGNETEYDFVVVTYANGSAKLLAATAAVLLLALAGYLIYYRKYIRVS